MSRFATVLVVGLLAAAAAAAARANTVEDALGKMADDIKTHADSKQVNDVRIEGFRGVGEFPTSGGPFLVAQLTRLLNQRGIVVKIKSRLVISGQYDEV